MKPTTEFLFPRFAMAIVIALGLSWQVVLAQSAKDVGSPVENLVRFAGTHKAKKSKLESMDTAQLDELRRKKLKFEQLSDELRQQVETIHGQLDENPEGDSLRLVMNRYYQWLKTLDEKTQRELLGLPSAERIERIRELRDAQAKELFGRVGATKLPDEDLGWVYEWIKQTVIAKKDKIDQLLNSDEVKARLPSTIRPMVSRPAINSRRSNYRFRLLVTHAPEFAREIAYEEFAKLRTKLSPAALEIIDAYPEHEQKDLVLQWFKAVDYAQNNVTNEKLRQFWLSLTPEDHEMLEQMSRSEWRRVLESRYFHTLRVNGGSDESPGKRPRSVPNLKQNRPKR